MSGKPSPKGAERVISLIQSTLASEVERLQLTTEADLLLERKAILDSSVARAKRELSDLLTSMDVDSPGNSGWEGRFTWFIAEVIRQTTKEEKTHFCDKCGMESEAERRILSSSSTGRPT